ncbi:MAG: N-acetyltransferase [Candidatus Aminicenantes bacterium]|nr:N-acetyltransferase [Candidatus Aminicenantes bacterium]
MIEVKKVESKKDLKKFIMLPWKIYKEDPNWVPPLISDVKKLLDRNHHPFHKHAEVEYFLAYKDGEVVGRIAAFVNFRHNEYWKEKTGFFGFFESINDKEVSRALFEKAEEFLREKEMDRMRGPMNFSTNETCGLLYKGFNSPPVIEYTYNPRYYIDLFEDYGMGIVRFLYAYRLTKDNPIPEKLKRVAEYRLKKIPVRKVNIKKIRQEIENFKIIYNEAWGKNWGFVPLTDEEIEHIAKELKPVLDTNIVFFAEIDGEPAGASLSLPDFNQILKYANGRLFPFGLIKLLIHRKDIYRLRTYAMGVREKYRLRGIEALLIYKTIQEGIKHGYKEADMGWILDNNYQMNRILLDLGAERYKEFAVYEKEF